VKNESNQSLKAGKKLLWQLDDAWLVDDGKCLREASKVCFVDAFVYQSSGTKPQRLGAYKPPCGLTGFRQFSAYFCGGGKGN
jgi:hypothetical protein